MKKETKKSVVWSKYLVRHYAVYWRWFIAMQTFFLSTVTSLERCCVVNHSHSKLKTFWYLYFLIFQGGGEHLRQQEKVSSQTSLLGLQLVLWLIGFTLLSVYMHTKWQFPLGGSFFCLKCLSFKFTWKYQLNLNYQGGGVPSDTSVPLCNAQGTEKGNNMSKKTEEGRIYEGKLEYEGRLWWSWGRRGRGGGRGGGGWMLFSWQSWKWKTRESVQLQKDQNIHGVTCPIKLLEKELPFVLKQILVVVSWGKIVLQLFQFSEHFNKWQFVPL